MTRATGDLSFRAAQLRSLKRGIDKFEPALFRAMAQDLGKSEYESYASEIGFVQHEISYHLKHLKKWARPQRITTDLVNFWSQSRVVREPHGVVLIIAPWNYPFHLLMAPLAGAISAGNCVVLKPAEYSSLTAGVLADLVADTFSPEYVTLFTGGRDMNSALLDERFDHIFFTGSPALGRVVMEKAAQHLTPVTLELGGKSPCIVAPDADLNVAARRIAFGKFINAGQTCIAPDYLFAHLSIKNALVEKIRLAIERFYGPDPRQSPDFGRIINPQHFSRIAGYMDRGEILMGGTTDSTERYIAPTLLGMVSAEAPVMQEEIFGPILPVLEYEEIDSVISFINEREKPLALYLFTGSRNTEKQVLSRTSSGGACVNDTVMQITNPRLPFGGVGSSGMGAYHGRHSFEAFSHRKSVLNKSTRIDIPLRYPPYRGKMGLARLLLR